MRKGGSIETKSSSRGVRRPREDDFVSIDPPFLIDVLDTEEPLPGPDQRGVRATVTVTVAVIVVMGDGGQRGNAQDPGENRGHRSSVLHDMSSSPHLGERSGPVRARRLRLPRR